MTRNESNPEIQEMFPPSHRVAAASARTAPFIPVACFKDQDNAIFDKCAALCDGCPNYWQVRCTLKS